MTQAKTFRISGDWMTDGYVSGRGRLEIMVLDGKAYDPVVYDVSPAGYEHEALISIEADDTLRAWGASTSFAPDNGEIDRVGRTAFKAA
ncbi:MAG: hypothetical protein AB1698_20400 [Pseudomonadota bacterium]